MGKGPALALLLAGPALSLPNMLVIRTILGNQKTIVHRFLCHSDGNDHRLSLWQSFAKPPAINVKFQIYGSGCRCKALTDNAKAAALGVGYQLRYRKITDMNDIIDAGGCVF